MPEAVTLDPESLRTAVTAVAFLVAGIELGCAFLMRGGREAGGDDL